MSYNASRGRSYSTGGQGRESASGSNAIPLASRPNVQRVAPQQFRDDSRSQPPPAASNRGPPREVGSSVRGPPRRVTYSTQVEEFDEPRNNFSYDEEEENYGNPPPRSRRPDAYDVERRPPPRHHQQQSPPRHASAPASRRQYDDDYNPPPPPSRPRDPDSHRRYEDDRPARHEESRSRHAPDQESRSRHAPESDSRIPRSRMPRRLSSPDDMDYNENPPPPLPSRPPSRRIRPPPAAASVGYPEEDDRQFRRHRDSETADELELPPPQRRQRQRPQDYSDSQYASETGSPPPPPRQRPSSNYDSRPSRYSNADSEAPQRQNHRTYSNASTVYPDGIYENQPPSRNEASGNRRPQNSASEAPPRSRRDEPPPPSRQQPQRPPVIQEEEVDPWSSEEDEAQVAPARAQTGYSGFSSSRGGHTSSGRGNNFSGGARGGAFESHDSRGNYDNVFSGAASNFQSPPRGGGGSSNPRGSYSNAVSGAASSNPRGNYSNSYSGGHSGGTPRIQEANLELPSENAFQSPRGGGPSSNPRGNYSNSYSGAGIPEAPRGSSNPRGSYSSPSGRGAPDFQSSPRGGGNPRGSYGSSYSGFVPSDDRGGYSGYNQQGRGGGSATGYSGFQAASGGEGNSAAYRTRALRGYAPTERTLEAIYDEDIAELNKYGDTLFEGDAELEVTGADMQCMESWEEMGLDSRLLDNVIHAQYLRPRNIQKVCIPHIQDGFSIKCRSETGSGKTAAFLIPIINELMKLKSQKQLSEEGPVALIIAPTRELVYQLFEQARKLANGTGITVACAFGQYNYEKNIQEVKRGCHILVACIGRLMDFVDMKHWVKLTQIKFFVLDEADRFFDGFTDCGDLSLTALLNHSDLPPKEIRQTLLFSATLDAPNIDNLVHLHVDEGKLISIKAKNATNTRIQYLVLAVPSAPAKFRYLIEYLKEITAANDGECPRTLVNVDRVAIDVTTNGFGATTIHGERAQDLREEAFAHFRQGKCRILVSTDVCARGVDVHEMDYVINYDLPEDKSDFVQRCGRTGRTHRGYAVSFYLDRDEAFGPIIDEIITSSGQESPEFLRTGIKEEDFKYGTAEGKVEEILEEAAEEGAGAGADNEGADGNDEEDWN